MPRTTAGTESRSDRKHRAILDAASTIFLSHGYLGTNMDLIAAEAKTSKQTVYKHFGSKEALFVEIVTSITDTAGDRVHNDRPGIGDDPDVDELLREYAERQLIIVLQPQVLQLRRIVIGEAGRFPELARVLYERGPKRAIGELTSLFTELRDRGLLPIDDPAREAARFNWLIMAEPLNRGMLLGDGAVPTRAQLRRHVADAVRFFLAACHTGDPHTAKRSRTRTRA
ncbi:TetR/AcrR family transcriptional regulator [Microlunatus parietis]|uniref:AcrR family transcriptional regulator n=1 Tax=Microlunatus parietis TaxID=682979 RepID=A0A7Y9I750_9ACTN|nr:TetR/AcrR family transcriptional regulator [Microlunatus parietis]NYE71516.1 AcrR family transcriptional regulator [Microlunatus parietis]